MCGTALRRDQFGLQRTFTAVIMAEKPIQHRESIPMNHQDSELQVQDPSTVDDDSERQAEALAKNIQIKSMAMEGPKKKSSSFQITRIITKSGRLDVTNEDADSLDDLDETNTEDLSSDFQELSNISRTVDIIGEQSLVDDNLAYQNSSNREDLTLHLKGASDLSIHPSANVKPVVLHQTTHIETVKDKIGDTQSRFKVVKIESKDPFKRGRWMCLDFLDPPVSDRGAERFDKATEDLTGSGNSSASSSVHYVPGIDDPSKNPLAANLSYANGPTLIETLVGHAVEGELTSIEAALVTGHNGAPAMPSSVSSVASAGSVASMPAGIVPASVSSALPRPDSSSLSHVHQTQMIASLVPPTSMPTDQPSMISSTPQTSLPPSDISAPVPTVQSSTPIATSQPMIVQSLSQTQLPAATGGVGSVAQSIYPISQTQLGLAISQAMLSQQDYTNLTAGRANASTGVDDIQSVDFATSEATYVTASEDKPHSDSIRVDRLTGSERLKLSAADSILRPPLFEMVSATMQPFANSVKEDERYVFVLHKITVASHWSDHFV